jgi:hypothetical protein
MAKTACSGLGFFGWFGWLAVAPIPAFPQRGKELKTLTPTLSRKRERG